MVVHRNFHELVRDLFTWYLTLSGMERLEDRTPKVVQFHALPAANGQALKSDLKPNDH